MTLKSCFKTAVEGWMMFWRHKFLHIQLQRFLMAVAQKLLARPINGSEVAFQIVRVNQIVRVFHQLAIPPFERRFFLNAFANRFRLSADPSP